MRLHARVLLLVPALLLAAPADAQTPLEPFRPAPRYSTFHVGAQLTGGVNEGRDLVFAWGRMAAPSRSAMARLELAGGLTSGRSLVDRVLAGPQLTLGWAFPSQHTSFSRDTRAEPYVLLGAAGYALARFEEEGDEEEGTGFAPAVSGGVGFRIFGDEWEVDLATLELVVEKRFGPDDATELFVRFGRADPPRGHGTRSRRPNGALPPPPPPGNSP